jgi:hypothetical protein
MSTPLVREKNNNDNNDRTSPGGLTQSEVLERQQQRQGR